MTNELEKHFFDTFGIEPEYTYLVTDTFYTNNAHTYTATEDDLIDYLEDKNCGRYKIIEVYKNYPQITDHILLELICILADLYDSNSYGYPLLSKDIKELKEDILDDLIGAIDVENDYPKGYTNKVRTLFKE